MDLLEHNKLFLGNKSASDKWDKEVLESQYLVDGTHSIVYKRPDVGKESDRKLKTGGRVY